jgi:DGQHR domain-containing protein
MVRFVEFHRRGHIDFPGQRGLTTMDRDALDSAITESDAATPAASRDDVSIAPEGDGKLHIEKAFLVPQGRRHFYSLALPSKLLAANCAVEARAENPIDGFQRLLDKKRAKEIAQYIDAGFGAIPSAVILSAQSRAHLQYDRDSGLLRFRQDPRAFLVIDGQHRIFGFTLAKKSVSVPVVIFNRLTRSEECQLFMDINTKQRPVPTELLLDIKQLSELESDAEALLRSVFDMFNMREDSVLKGLLSPAEKRKGKITRVTFNSAFKAIQDAFVDASAEDVYQVMNAYLAACVSGLAFHKAQENIANPVLFKALVMLFANIAERVSDRHGGKYTVANFEEVLHPFLRRLKKNELPKPGATPPVMLDYFRKTLSAGFSLKNWLFI